MKPIQMPLIVKPFRANRFVFTVDVESVTHKIFQVIFGKDGSLYVDFPYYEDLPGIVSIASIPSAKQGASHTIKLAEEGKVTSNKVKYAHHWSGIAHFSKAGQVNTEVGKKSVRLQDTGGHIFTIQIQALSGFKVASSPKDEDHYDEKRTVLRYDFRNDVPEAIKFVGRWYRLDELAKNSVPRRRNQGFIGPLITGETPEGERTQTFVISPPLGFTAENYALLVGCRKIPALTQEPGSHLTMIGGFDSRERVFNHSQATQFLALSYPVSDYDELRSRIGTIDQLLLK